jgi:hypothetical protein
MFDYAAWLRRAELFVRGLKKFPGELHVNVDIAPPLSIDETNALCASLPFELPRPLYDFFTAGSASVDFYFLWEPTELDLPLLWQAIPDEHEVWGGLRCFSACAFGENGWARDIVVRKPDIPLQDGHLWNECIPFVHIPNGDYLALHVQRDDGRMPVLYLSHDAWDTSSAFEIAPSLEQFLIDWEQLCYIGPEIWLLCHFLNDDDTGPFHVDSPIAVTWREIMSGQRFS